MSLQIRLLSLVAAGAVFVACTHTRPGAVVKQRDPASLDGEYQACEEIQEVVYQAPRVNYGTLTRTYANVRDNVFKQHCSSCHFGSEAYVPRLDTYETASASAAEILRTVEGGTMPPSAPLTQRQAEAVAFLRAWVAEGAPR